ncbi:MAG TPA: MerR family transcriptional regulator [Thermoanaerobaculia bacterium]|jgi:DNA-binding transcriptional MerR regulator|nr:MerR family transcriptional regulator [Thermoanaerobaculia bacterium]HEV8608835.1 MerR family transcriptional regulator [Thermoanaerobaculia bacterium]
MAKAESQLYKPADACRMAEVAPYVLRYWETEFPALSEGKEKEGARLYTARDVQIIARIRQLLYDEGFTVAGAKKRLEAEIFEGRFDEGAKAPPSAGERPRPIAAPVAPEPAKPVAPSAAPTASAPPPVEARQSTSAPAAPSGFPERNAVIKELKDIVRLLERPKKR